MAESLRAARGRPCGWRAKSCESRAGLLSSGRDGGVGSAPFPSVPFMTNHGYLALVLHAHLPFVRHPEYPEFLEEDWLFEAITETYLPLLGRVRPAGGGPRAFRADADDDAAALRDAARPAAGSSVTCVISTGRSSWRRRKRSACAVGGRAEDTALFLPRTPAELPPPVRSNAGRATSWARSGVSRTRGYLEIITCAATHGLLPLMENIPRPCVRKFHRAGRLQRVFRARPGGHLAAGVRLRRRDRPGFARGESCAGSSSTRTG